MPSSDLSTIFEHSSPDDVKTSMYFMMRDKLFLEEKPYAFRFPVPKESVPQTNMKMERKEPILIQDMRRNLNSFSLEYNGFEIVPHESRLLYEDFYSPNKVTVYLRELEQVLKVHLQASRVEIFRYGLRKRDPAFPTSTGEKYEYDQPTSVAHIDTTPQEAREEVRRQCGEKAELLLNKRFQWINIWKPLKGPLNDWPLALCDASTVDANNDLEAADLLYPDFATENYQVYSNPKFQWYYLKDHNVSELIIFRQSDSNRTTCPGVPHCSFFNPLTPEGEAPRESIEARALVYYDD